MVRRSIVAALVVVASLSLVAPRALAQASPYGPYPYSTPPGAPSPAAPGTPAPPYGAPSGGATPYGAGYPYGGAPASTAPPSPTDRDSGRKLEFFYARAGAGGGAALLTAFGGSDSFELADPSGVGGAFEAGLGLRLLVLTVGPRARALLLSNATLWQLGGEVALRLPLGRWDPFVGLQGGYTFGSKPAEDVECAGTAPCGPSNGAVGIAGADVGLAGGADYYVTPALSLGADLAVMMLFLTRDAVPGTGQPLLDAPASMTGLGMKLGVHVALHL